MPEIVSRKACGACGYARSHGNRSAAGFVGRATRAVEFASEAGKEYLAGIRLGVITDTQDTTGTVLEKRPVDVTREQLEQALSSFRGGDITNSAYVFCFEGKRTKAL